MSKNEEFPSKSTGEAGSSSGLHQRTGSSSEGINCSGGVVEQETPTGSMIYQSSLMTSVMDGIREHVKARNENRLEYLDKVEGPLTYQQTQAVQANANMRPQSEYPPAAVQSFPSGQHQMPPSASDSSLLVHSSTSGITNIEHKSQQPLNFDKRDDTESTTNLSGNSIYNNCGRSELAESQFSSNKTKIEKYEAAKLATAIENISDEEVNIEGTGEDDEPETFDDDLETKRRYAQWENDFQHLFDPYHTEEGHSEDEREPETRYVQGEDELLHSFDSRHSEEVNSEGTGDSEDEPKPKRRIKKAYVSEPASSHTTVRESRTVVTTSEDDVLGDGYMWRKYGKKIVKGNLNPRTYFKCTTQGCRVRKRVDREAKNPKTLVTTYEGKHNHDPPALTRYEGRRSYDPPPAKSSNHDNVIAGSRANFSLTSMSSKNLQDKLSIDFPWSQSFSIDELFADTSDLSGPLSTCVSYSTSNDYDVVIRYERGDISINNFVSHLCASLCRRGISVYEEFNEGNAIPEYRLLIILLTSTYVPWNLLKILDQQQHTENQVIYPIFYRLSPHDFVCNSKYYERFFLREEPERWQASLKKLTQMPGYTLTDKCESNLIDEIVRDALKVLCSGDKVSMPGMHMQVEEILSLLCVESLHVRSVGILGMVGIGKTTIAEAIFHRISAQYETSVFFKDLHQQIKVKGLDAVKEDFFSKVLEVEPHLIRISDIKTSFLRSRLQRKRVFVILDDVNDYKDVETCLGKLNYFGPGSRIIITSRNRRVFELCKVDHIFEVKPLDIPNSLQLLDRGMFQISKALSLELVKYSNGNPQVLQFLSGRQWDGLSSHKLQQSFPICIPGIFERSCCGLDDNEMSIFLDIACFFRRMNKDNVAMLLDGCGFSAHVGFRSLVDKSLLLISHNMVDMLTFIQATGREIVRQESSDRPGDRSRLWNAEDIRDVFLDDTGTSAIEGIFLDMSKLRFDANPNMFEKMSNLRLLKMYCSKEKEKHGVSFPQGLEYLPRKLRLLHWEYYPLHSLPKSFNPENLVELNLSSSCVTKLWKGKKNLEKLRKMRLSFSNQLTKIPRLSSATNLEHLDLEGCNSLLSLRQSISHLKKLVFLNLKDCINLESIPSTVGLESLEVLNLSGCSKLENFQEISPNLKELYIGGTMIQEIPSSIKDLVLLEKLDLENSKHLKNLPTSICKLKHLETLNLSGCTNLDRFPDLSRKMRSLRFLDLSRTAIQELPSSISNLIALEELRFADCRNLVKLPDKSLAFQIEFRQIDTEKFSRLWNRFHWLKKVQKS